MDQNDSLAEQFEAHRTHLRAVAYRMLGSVTEADDAVEESWLRLSRSNASEVENLGGWLTTVTARVSSTCCDRARLGTRSSLGGTCRSRSSTPVDGTAPEHEALVADSVGLALLLVLETLDPAERLALCCTTCSASRSPRSPRSSIAPRRRRGSSRAGRVGGCVVLLSPTWTSPLNERVVVALLAAAREGDFEALLRVLDPGVVLRADTGALAAVAVREVRGAEAVARQARGFTGMLDVRLALVNGAWPGNGQDTALGPAPARACASWTPKPRRADADSLADAVARCRNADPRGAELPIAATERRGGFTLVFRTDGARRALCIAGPHGRLLSLPAPPKLPAGEAPPGRADSFPIEEVVYPGPGNPLAARVGILVGRVAPNVGAVEISPAHGVAVTATVSRDYFVAWWPGTAEDAAHAMIRARSDVGNPVTAFQLLGRDASLVELAQDPSTAEPLPAEVSEVEGSGPQPILTVLTPRADLSREIAVRLSGAEGADRAAPDCQEFSTDERRAASPSLAPECRHPSR